MFWRRGEEVCAKPCRQTALTDRPEKIQCTREIELSRNLQAVDSKAFLIL